eukprot:scaffold69661_cov63-Phaeocystis_antarctica.AAC.4
MARRSPGGGGDAMERRDAAEAAVRQAAAEGLTLQPSDNSAGYRGVRKDCRSKSEAKPFEAYVQRAGEKVYLGRFATAEEAALAYARKPEAHAQVANPKPAPLTAEEVVAQAKAEGLKLERSNGTAGYRGVSIQGRGYQAYVYRDSKQVSPGSFVTAEEAALAVARADARNDPPAKQSCNSSAQAGPLQPDSGSEDGINVEVVEVVEVDEEDAKDAEGEEEEEDDEEEDEEEDQEEEDQEMDRTDAAEAAVRQAEAEGLTLQPSDNSATGYRCVRKDGAGRTRFQATVQRAGEKVHLGCFATAEEAALAYARTPEAQTQVAAASGPKPAPLTAREAVAQAAAEGLKLERSNRTAGYKGVSHIGPSYQAYACAGGKMVYLGSFTTAEEAALTIARADARTDPPAASPRPAAAMRAAPPQKPPPAKVHPKARPNSEEPTVAPSPAFAATASVRLEVGQSVEACFGGRGYWFPGVVQHINEDGTLAIDYEDGDQEERVLRKHVRPPKAKARPPSPLASTSSGRLRTAPRRLDASLVVVPSRSCRSAGEASSLEEEEDSEGEPGEPATHAAEAGDQTDAAEAAVRQAKAEGLTLQPTDNATGYRGVYYMDRSKALAKPFCAQVRRAGKSVHLGRFATVEEAALAYARTPEAQAQVGNPKPAPLTAREAVAQAAAEGLTLERSNRTAGYRGVSYKVEKSRYQANVWRSGKQVSLGSFVTAEEAALAYARTPEAQAQVAAASGPKPAPLTAQEAVAQAAAEGLRLEPSNSAAGYKGVSYKVDNANYQAQMWRSGKNVHLGNFVTAEEAALAVARADARTDPPAASPAAAKRAAPPPKPPPAKQPRHTPPPRPVQPVPLPQRDAPAPQASPKLEAAAATIAPAPVLFLHKLALLKRELEIAPATPAIPAVAEANQQMGITPSLGESLGVQLDRLLAIIS